MTRLHPGSIARPRMSVAICDDTHPIAEPVLHWQDDVPGLIVASTQREDRAAMANARVTVAFAGYVASGSVEVIDWGGRRTLECVAVPWDRRE